LINHTLYFERTRGKMRKEFSLYLFVGLLIVGTFLAVYYLGVGLTGFAVLGESGSGFNGTFENTLYDSGTSAVVLSSNQTSGAYTSKIFDANASVNWNSLTSQKTTPANTSISFEVRNCSTSDCSGSSFVSLSDLSNLNLTGQYFQYKTSFSGLSTFDNATNVTTFTSPSLESVSVDYSAISAPAPVATSVTIFQPKGTKTSSKDLHLDFSALGTNITCWYNVHNASNDAEIVANTSISGCNNMTFDLTSGNRAYALRIFVNGTLGLASDSSSFSVQVPSTPASTPPATNTTVIEPAPVEVVIPKITALTAPAVVAPTLIPGNSEQIKWTVQNTGTEPISACAFKSNGERASWISAPEGSYNLNNGELHEFAFTITAPNGTADGSYPLSVSAGCAEISLTKDFTLAVEKKKLDFEIIDAQKTRADRIRVVYSLKELTGNKQNVTVYFSLLNLANVEVANVSQNRTMNANQTKEFTANIPINASVNGSFVGNFSLSATANSEVYKASVLSPITLGTPVGGFTIFTGLGTGSYVLIVSVIVVLLAVFFVVRRMRKKPGKVGKE
jgi:hypothetical protein